MSDNGFALRRALLPDFPTWIVCTLVFFIGAPSMAATITLFCMDHDCSDSPPTVSWAATHWPGRAVFTPGFNITGFCSVIAWWASSQLFRLMQLVVEQGDMVACSIPGTKLLAVSRLLGVVSVVCGGASGGLLIALSTITLNDSQWGHTICTQLFFSTQLAAVVFHAAGLLILRKIASPRNDTFKFLCGVWEDLRLLNALAQVLLSLGLVICFIVVNEYADIGIPISKHFYSLVEFGECVLALSSGLLIGLQVRQCRRLAFKNQ
eukprot:TRINITY_DN10887_c0_g1_i1.p1 TRINITY_DN10887_c0_g1~~TRINITY_DN10887_c0_g1_i1.p1  ORF type:complete len:264 (-),score=44.04 TRINITY_DN10887_c0_g1_i1:471-1262(-)